MGRPGTLLHCIECGAASDELAAGWRAYLAQDDGEEESRLELFCPQCADRQFGPLGWEDPGEPPPSEMV